MDKASLTVRHFLQRIRLFIRHNKLEFFLLVVILAIGAFCRLYRISEYMTFLGDEGRDAIVVRRLLVNGDPILVGPGTSIGNMYLGPLYYYFIAPFLWLFQYSPVGPSVLIAIVGVLTIFLLWFASREWFGSTGALGASLLYALSPTIIIYSRSSWNPNIMPFFALLTAYGVWRIWRNASYPWFIISGISFAFVLQSHYLGLLLAPFLLVFVFLAFWNAKKLHRLRSFFLYASTGLISFLFLMSPLVIFDARHGWRNFEAIKTFFTARQETVSIKPWNALPKAYPQFEKIIIRLVGGRNEIVGKILVVFYIATLAWFFGLYHMKLSKKEKLAYVFLFVWTGFALLGLALYKQEIYDHYYGFIAPAVFLLLAGMIEHIATLSRFRSSVLVTIFVAFLAVVNISESPLKYPPNRQLQRSEDVTTKIIEDTKGQPFNLAVIAERNYEGGYQYFLEKEGAPLLEIDPQRANETIASHLYVACEMEESKCDPTHNSKAQVAAFGWSKIDQQWNIDGTILYRLVHSKP